MNIKYIGGIEFNSFTKKQQSIILNNVIESKYGNARIYKSKKRMELRLTKNILEDECTIKLY